MEIKYIKLSALVIVPALCALWSCESRTAEDISESSVPLITSEDSAELSVSGAVAATDSVTVPETKTAETEPVSSVPSVSVIQPQAAPQSVSQSVSASEPPAESQSELPETTESYDFVPEQSDDEIIMEAQYLFGEACLKEWNFTVGSPYELDESQYITNDYGWRYYLVTEPDINSFADVMADYHMIFSPEYPDTLSEIFIEDDGHVYCLNGMRGSDIFFEQTVLSGIISRSENEIVFTAESTYSDDGLGNGITIIENEFSIVKNDDGEWRVSRFRLPY
ncbi:MAG: hypothetical protein K2N49_01130 [Ruminococcus sp.]|nr:hypothetical protein [Ruminococcus sp.]MDE7225453.1 hypothetical protein [Ruminococcus sp.]